MQKVKKKKKRLLCKDLIEAKAEDATFSVERKIKG